MFCHPTLPIVSLTHLEDDHTCRQVYTHIFRLYVRIYNGSIVMDLALKILRKELGWPSMTARQITWGATIPT